MNNKNLRKNLLVIRELYRMFYDNILSDGKSLFQPLPSFFNALGITQNIYSKLLNGDVVKLETVIKLAQHLESIGISPEYLLPENAVELKISPEISQLTDRFVESNCTDKTDKDKLLKALYAHLGKQFAENNVIISELFVLFYSAFCSMNSEHYDNTEVLADLANSYYKDDSNGYYSIYYAQYISELAQHVNDVEKAFPELYAVAQRMSNTKTASTSDITVSLESLKQAIITLQSKID